MGRNSPSLRLHRPSQTCLLGGRLIRRKEGTLLKRRWVLWTVIGAGVFVFGCTGLLGLGLLLGDSAEDRRLVDTALDAEDAAEEARRDYQRYWEAVASAFTQRGATLARDNYLDGKESDTPDSIRAASTYRRAVEYTDIYIGALRAVDVALDAVEEAGAWDLLERTTMEPPTPEPEPVAKPTPDTRHRLVQRFGCTWIMDNYRTMAPAGRDTAILHVSNVMNLQDAGGYVSAGDAGAAIRECEG